MITPFRVTILALVIGVGAAAVISLQQPNPPAEPDYPQPAVPVMGPLNLPPPLTLSSGTQTKTASGLTIIDTKEGTGPAVKQGDMIVVQYIGRIYNGGKEFDNSYKSGRPLNFRVDPQNGMIAGFNEGLIGMKAGGKRQLVIPPGLAYGERTPDPNLIPPNSTLVFDLELVSVN